MLPIVLCCSHWSAKGVESLLLEGCCLPKSDVRLVAFRFVSRLTLRWHRWKSTQRNKQSDNTTATTFNINIGNQCNFGVGINNCTLENVIRIYKDSHKHKGLHNSISIQQPIICICAHDFPIGIHRSLDLQNLNPARMKTNKASHKWGRRIELDFALGIMNSSLSIAVVRKTPNCKCCQNQTFQFEEGHVCISFCIIWRSMSETSCNGTKNKWNFALHPVLSIGCRSGEREYTDWRLVLLAFAFVVSKRSHGDMANLRNHWWRLSPLSRSEMASFSLEHRNGLFLTENSWD